MKRISLTQGKYAIVDDETFERLNRHKWHAWWNKDTKSYYAKRQSKVKNGKQHSIYMAREILGLTYRDKRQADHIDHDTLDNRTLNLRIVTRNQNQWNQKNTKGYDWRKDAGKYQARITVNGKRIYLGRFRTALEAREAYLKAKKVYHRISN